MSRAHAALACAGRVLLAVCVASLLFLLVAPRSVLSFLRREYEWLGRLADWAETVSVPGLNLAHVLAFAVVGLVARLALPRARSVHVVPAAVGIAILTELVQFWLPGRTPRLWDVVDDIGGTLLGLALGSLVLRLRPRPERSNRDGR